MFAAALPRARQLFICLLALLFCLAVLTEKVHAQTVTPVVRAGEAYNVTPGTFVDIPVFISNAPNIAGFQFDLRYDPEVAIVRARPGATAAVKLGSFFTGSDPIVNMNFAATGLIRVAWMDLSEKTGSGEICRITFEVRSTGTTVLDMMNVELVNRTGIIGQDVSVVDGMITSGPQLDVSVSGVIIPGGNRNIVQGNTVQLSAAIEPNTATNKTVTWNSSNTAVATVSGGGLVTAVGEGSAVITVTTADGGFTDTVTITVRPAGIIVNTPRDLPHAYTGRYYDHNLTARGENVSFTWSMISGSLPPGLRLDSSGRIYGTPSGTGRFDFKVRVTDAAGNRTDQDFVMWVAESASTGYHSGMLYHSDWGAFKNLNINHGSLEVNLQPHELPYTMVVDRNTSNVMLQVSLIRSSDRLTINGTTQSPTSARTITLRPRTNVITMSIQSWSGDPKHYNLTIYKLP